MTPNGYYRLWLPILHQLNEESHISSAGLNLENGLILGRRGNDAPSASSPLACLGSGKTRERGWTQRQATSPPSEETPSETPAGSPASRG